LSLCERMGGLDGDLLVQGSVSNLAPLELELDMAETVQPNTVA
jgi:hypothetical protein